MRWPFRRKPLLLPPPRTSAEVPQDVLRLLMNLSITRSETDRMLSLLQTIQADLDTLKAELANQTGAIQANAAAKAELDASTPVAEALAAQVADLKSQFAVATAAPTA